MSSEARGRAVIEILDSLNTHHLFIPYSIEYIVGKEVRGGGIRGGGVINSPRIIYLT